VKCPSSAGGYLCQPLIQGASTKYCQIAR
jgi:hypothetical protein